MAVFAVIGGGSKIALHFTRLATQAKHTVHSLVRNDVHDADIIAAGGKPTLFSLEDDTPSDLAAILRRTRPSAVLFSAGAGGKGGPERTRAVDYEGALKVFDGMELAGVERIVLISAADVRDRGASPPSHYNTSDLKRSDHIWDTIGSYMHYKLLADQDLLSRRALKPTILRPGLLTDAPPSKRVLLGSPHLTQVSRADVAGVALRLLEADGAAGLVLDLMEGTEEGDAKGKSWEEAVRRVVSKKTE